MRIPRRFASVLPATVLLLLSATPTAAQPATEDRRPSGRVLAEAGAGGAVVRVLPTSATASTVLPDYARPLPSSVLELGFGLSSARVNSESSLSWERSVAQASPGGVAVQGAGPQSPGTVAQTAAPDNPQPRAFELRPPPTPLDALLHVGELSGSVRARWSDTVGPCVDPVSEATTTLAGFAAFSAVPTLPGTQDLSGRLTESSLDQKQAEELIESLRALRAPLAKLGGLLAGPSGAKPDGTGSLVGVRDTLSTRSTVRLVDIPGSATKAVQSTSTVRANGLTLLGGTPFEMAVTVVNQPTVTVTATGDAASSKVDYSAPVLEVRRNDKVLHRLDAAQPTVDIPIGIALPELTGRLPETLRDLPLVGDLADALPADSPLLPEAAALNRLRLDIGVMRLTIGGLQQQDQAMAEPFQGHRLGAIAHLLDLQVLPTKALALPGLPAALAQVSVGELVTRAAAPTGGIQCDAADHAAPDQPLGGTTSALAYSSAYQAVPLFWTGVGMLFVGVIIVAALPPRRSQRPVRPTPFSRGRAR